MNHISRVKPNQLQTIGTQHPNLTCPEMKYSIQPKRAFGLTKWQIVLATLAVNVVWWILLWAGVE